MGRDWLGPHGVNVVVQQTEPRSALLWEWRTSIQLLKAAARMADGKRSTGARLIACFITTAEAPPDSVIALQPRRVDAMRVPSTVAIGTWKALPLMSSGPATPTGSGT